MSNNEFFPGEIKVGFPDKRVPKWTLLLVGILIFFVLNTQASQGDESGNPFILNYTDKDYNAHFQNWAILQDKRGVMYFGNNHGVLEFDGHDWRLIKVSNNSIVRSLAQDDKGTIYVGAGDEFGYLANTHQGNLTYVSLSNQLPDEEKKFGDVWSINTTSHGVYFKTYTKIFRYYRRKIDVIRYSSNPFSFTLHDEVFIHGRGIFILEENTPRLLPHTQFLSLSAAGLLFVLPYPGNRLLIATERKGIFIYDLSLLYQKRWASSVTIFPRY